MNMTTQQKLDCLLKHFDMLAESQGDGVALVDQDIALLKKQCRFANPNEIGFYIRALGERGLVISDCAACSAPGSLDTSLSHAAGLIEIAACHA